ncbi:MAG: hypothetical protein PSN34_01060 [Urechidicola sp.]|nr:hypothetical protein [Urechidicola sp.]
MCDFSTVVEYSILKTIDDYNKQNNQLRINDVLSDLSAGNRYSVYVALNRMPIHEYIQDRIKHKKINIKDDGLLSLSREGEVYFKSKKSVIDRSSHKDYWLERAYA